MTKYFLFSSFKFSFNKLFRLMWRLENFFKIENWNISCKYHMQGFALLTNKFSINWNISCKYHMQGFVLLTNKFSIYSLVLQKSLTEKWACFPPNQNVYFFQIAEKSRIQTIYYSVCKNILLKVFRVHLSHWLLNKPILSIILQYEEKNLSNQELCNAKSKIEFFAATRTMTMAGGCVLLKQRAPC